MPPKPSAVGVAKSAKSGSSAPKPKKEKSASTSSNADFLKTEDVLQAVLLADSFQVKFRPLTQQKPKVLLPLLNIPLLEYSLEFLISGGVGELFVFCCSHAQQIQQYIDSVENGSKWKRRKGLIIRTIVSNSCFSFGDAMRHLDTLDLIKRDFVLISGDVISNLKLDDVVKQHKARVAQDKRNMMTLILKQASHAHRTRPLADDAVLAIDPATSQLLLYENDRSSSRISLDNTLLMETKSAIQLRYDLMDSHISICTPEVLMLFTDNFDWQTFHGDFLTGVLGSEILGNKLFVHIISRDEYAARCQDLRTYDSITKDVIHRWTYPMVPDNNLLGSGLNTTYKFHRGNIYKEDNVAISRSAKIGEETTIGAGTSIGEKSSIKGTVIGRDCVIGKNVQISGSYLWSGVTIEDNVVLDRAILADGVTVRAGARISHGAILSYNVVIGPNHVVPPYTKITTVRSDDGDEDGADDEDEDEDEEDGLPSKPSPKTSTSSNSPSAESVDGEWSVDEVGVGGVGRIYSGKQDDEEDDEDYNEEKEDGEEKKSFPYKQSELNSIAPNPVAVQAWLRQQFADESEDEWADDGEAIDEDEEEDELDPSLANQMGATALNQNFHKFAHEAAETIKRGHVEKLSLDDISLEMNGLKFSHNTTIEEFAHATFLAFFQIVNETVNPTQTATLVVLDPTKNKQVMQSLGGLLKQWWRVLGKFGKLVSDQVYMLHGLEQACLASGFVSTNTPSNVSASSSTSVASIYTPLFTPTLQLLYQNFELFSEDAILQWAEALQESEGEDHILLKQSSAFRQWLEEADEEEDDEEEED